MVSGLDLTMDSALSEDDVKSRVRHLFNLSPNFKVSLLQKG